jgi:hypothetical protein
MAHRLGVVPLITVCDALDGVGVARKSGSANHQAFYAMLPLSTPLRTKLLRRTGAMRKVNGSQARGSMHLGYAEVIQLE